MGGGGRAPRPAVVGRQLGRAPPAARAGGPRPPVGARGGGRRAGGAAGAAWGARRAGEGNGEPPLSGDHDSYRWRGMDVHYTEAGDPDDETLVCVHGINAAGSGGEFREIVADLAEDHHVVAPDLPGFGCSDRPPLRYSAALYEDFVGDFLAEYDEPAVLASSLSASYVTSALERGDTDASRLALICPTPTVGPEPPTSPVPAPPRAPALFASALPPLPS